MPKKNNQIVPTMQDVDDPGSLINQVFKRLTPPKGDFNKDGTYSLIYRDISTFSPRHVQGEVSLKHGPDGKLKIQSYRDTPDKYRYYTIADLKCTDFDWCAPTSWTVETKVAEGADRKAYLDSGLTKKANVKNGILSLQSGGAKHELKLPGLYNCKWALLNSIGRLRKLNKENVEFTMIDEYDQLCPGQKISLRGKNKMKTKNGEAEIWSYQHTGTGTMPGVFYVDEAGRVLFYMAGMQLLALGVSDKEKTGY